MKTMWNQVMSLVCLLCIYFLFLVSRDFIVAKAKAVADKVKEVTQKTLEGLETFLRRKGMSRDGPYKDAIQKLKKGEKIDDKVGAQIASYIYPLLRGFRAFFFTVCRVKDWDDEIVGEITKFIKRKLYEHLEVEVKEVQELLKIAENVCKESDETWKLMKVKRLKNRVLKLGDEPEVFGKNLEVIGERNEHLLLGLL